MLWKKINHELLGYHLQSLCSFYVVEFCSVELPQGSKRFGCEVNQRRYIYTSKMLLSLESISYMVWKTKPQGLNLQPIYNEPIGKELSFTINAVPRKQTLLDFLANCQEIQIKSSPSCSSTKTCWRVFISHLAWKHLGIPTESSAGWLLGRNTSRATLLCLLSLRSGPRNEAKIGRMDSLLIIS